MESLHYRNEKALAFNVFISKSKKLFNIFDECDESIPEQKKLRFLWESIKDPKLTPTIEAIKASLNRDPDSWSFVDTADHLASQIPAVNKASHLSSLIATPPGPDDAPTTGVMKGGKVFTGSYSRDAWNKLSKAEKDKVFNARNGSSKSGKPSNRKIKSLRNKVKKQSKKTEEQKSKLSSLTTNDNGKSDSNASSVSSTSVGSSANAGIQFGGKSSRGHSSKQNRGVANDCLQLSNFGMYH